MKTFWKVSLKRNQKIILNIKNKQRGNVKKLICCKWTLVYTLKKNVSLLFPPIYEELPFKMTCLHLFIQKMSSDPISPFIFGY